KPASPALRDVPRTIPKKVPRRLKAMKSKERRSAMWGRSILILGALLILSAGIAFAGRAKLSKDLEGKQPSDQLNVIVQFRNLPTAKQHNAVLKRGGNLHRELTLMHSGAYSIPASALADLEANPDVAYVSVDRPLSSTASVSTSAPVVDHHTEAIQAAAAWARGLDGTGIAVAVIDSGIAPVRDLNGNAVVY